MVLLRIWSGDDFQKSTSGIEKGKIAVFAIPSNLDF
jgi:hypothetical protein